MNQPSPNTSPPRSADKAAPVKPVPSPIRLIVGLGNPGAEYERTRHNAGCWAIDEMARVLGAGGFSPDKKMKADVASVVVDGRKVWLIKPQTFMNCSGQSVGPFARFHDIRPNEVLDTVADITKIKKELHWTPKISLIDGIKSMMD